MNPRITCYRRVGKRALDLVMSVSALILLSPLLLVVALMVRLFLGSPVLYRQSRSGIHRRGFTILKFRTMTDARDDRGELLPDSARLTRLGRWLRMTSIDELPELFNVLAGDMSLVGPRPLITRYDPYYRPDEVIRFEAFPGITGWAQVNGRNELSWEQRFAHDGWYVANLSLWLDLKILLLTIGKVLRREKVCVDTTTAFLSLDVQRQRGDSLGNDSSDRLAMRFEPSMLAAGSGIGTAVPAEPQS